MDALRHRQVPPGSWHLPSWVQCTLHTCGGGGAGGRGVPTQLAWGWCGASSRLVAAPGCVLCSGWRGYLAGGWILSSWWVCTSIAHSWLLCGCERNLLRGFCTRQALQVLFGRWWKRWFKGAGWRRYPAVWLDLVLSSVRGCATPGRVLWAVAGAAHLLSEGQAMRVLATHHLPIVYQISRPMLRPMHRSTRAWRCLTTSAPASCTCWWPRTWLRAVWTSR